MSEGSETGVTRTEVLWFLVSSAWKGDSLEEQAMGISWIALILTILLTVSVLVEVLL